MDIKDNQADLLEAAKRITAEVFEATGTALSPSDPEIAFGVIAQVAIREMAKALTDTMAAHLEAERQERQALKIQVHELRQVVQQLNTQIADLVRDDPEHPGAIMRLKTIALSMIKAIRG